MNISILWEENIESNITMNAVVSTLHPAYDSFYGVTDAFLISLEPMDLTRYHNYYVVIFSG